MRPTQPANLSLAAGAHFADGGRHTRYDRDGAFRVEAKLPMTMPNIILEPNDLSNVVAYILRLKN
jgi:hypothetical protein